MSDAAWGFWGSVIGSLIGGAIAYFVAIKAAAAQTRASWEIQHDKHQKELAWQLLQEIDEYVLCSFRPQEDETRQRAARRMLTAAALCMPEQIPAIKHWVGRVNAYHHAKQQGRPPPKGVSFTALQQFCEGLQSTLTQKHFDFTWPSAGQSSEF